MKDCIFQYGTNQRILVDTDLITMSEALELLENNRADFIERLESDESPEMALWINCKSNDGYGETSHHWHADDFKVIDGELYQRV
jgi:DNA topoisomerase VI subunit A